MNKKLFGKMSDGREVYEYTLENGRMKAQILDLGGIVRVLECDGIDVVGGFDTLDGVVADTTFQGALVGRYGNRIKRAQFTLNGVTYPLYANNGKNHLHGGKEGFNRKIWEVKDHSKTTLTLFYSSADGEEGYPGKLDVTVKYTLYPDAIRIDYDAVSDKDTYCNLTNHAYFNLNGVGAGQITDHTMMINHTTYTAVDSELIPTGEHPSLDGSPYDFREPKKIGRDLVGKDKRDELYGYDHNFILDTTKKELFDGCEYNFASEISGDKLTMKVLTTKPCMQVYTGAFLEDDGNDFKGGVKKFSRMALAMETQFEPDSPTRGENVLRAGERYEHSTVYKF